MKTEIISRLIAVIIHSLFFPFLFMSYWNWFVSPLGVMEIGYLHAIGLLGVVGVLLFSVRDNIMEIHEIVKKPKDKDRIYKFLAMSLTVYLIGYATNYFMVI